MENISNKKRLIALILCWFLGVIGVHRYYVGKHATSIAMFLISITGFGLIITGVWAFIDFVMIIAGSFKDAEGKILKNWD